MVLHCAAVFGEELTDFVPTLQLFLYAQNPVIWVFHPLAVLFYPVCFMLIFYVAGFLCLHLLARKGIVGFLRDVCFRFVRVGATG